MLVDRKGLLLLVLVGLHSFEGRKAFASRSEYRLFEKGLCVFMAFCRLTGTRLHVFFSRRELCGVTLTISRSNGVEQTTCASGCGGGPQSHHCPVKSRILPSSISEGAGTETPSR